MISKELEDIIKMFFIENGGFEKVADVFSGGTIWNDRVANALPEHKKAFDHFCPYFGIVDLDALVFAYLSPAIRRSERDTSHYEHSYVLTKFPTWDKFILGSNDDSVLINLDFRDPKSFEILEEQLFSRPGYQPPAH